MADDGDDPSIERGDGAQPPTPPRGSLPLLYQNLTLQRVALAVFVGLAGAIVLVTIVALIIPQDNDKSLAISRTLTVLLITALACAAVAWLDGANFLMLGRGMKHLLTIQRAAVASFVGASLATIGVAIFVALSALFAGGLEKGLYALASIEFLLKLAAVSAIVVLMTLRKPLIWRPNSAQKRDAQNAKDNEDGGNPADDDQEDNGRLEFGGLSFAFSLVVIAALIVPGEDLMRMASMFFGGQEKLEQYLPSRPVVTVEDDLSNQITRAVIQSIASRDMFASMSLPELERQIDSLALQNQIFAVIADNLLNNVERRGALTLLREVCDDNEDTLIFANSDDRVLAEHIAFLSAEGLIEHPYGDINSIEITNYGSNVVKKSTGGNCRDIATAEPLVATSSDDATIASVPYENTLTLPAQGVTFAIGLPEGRYRAELVAIDRIDPVLELLTEDGATVILTDDDGGPGFLDSGLDFDVTAAGQKFTLRASTIDGQGGRASLRLIQRQTAITATSQDSPLSSPRVRQIDVATSTRTIGAVPFSEAFPVSSTGTIFQLALEGGQYRASLIASDSVDPFLQLFDAEGALVDENDDDDEAGGVNSAISFTIQEGERYFVRASSYGDRPGAAQLLIDQAPVDSAAQIILDNPAVPLADVADVPPGGAVFSFQALTTGEHSIQTSLPPGNQSADSDLVAVLFRVSGEQRDQIAYDDDSGFNNFPGISAVLTQGETYLLVLRHYGTDAKQTPVAISVSPPVSTDASAPPVVPDASEAPAPSDVTTPDTAAESAPAAEPVPTGSDGSQSSP